MRLDFEAILGLLFFVVFVVLPLVRGGKKASQQQQQQGQPGQPGQGVPGQPARQAQPGAPGQPARQLAPGQAPAPGRTVLSQGAPRPPSTTAGQPPAPDSLLATIEEVRRRVKEAQDREEAARRSRMGGTQQPTASAAPQPGSLVSSSPFDSTLVSSAPRTVSGAPVQRGPSASQPSRPPPPSLRQPPPSALGREGVISEDMRVERLQPVKPTVRPTREDARTEEQRRKARSMPTRGAVPARIGASALLAADRDAIMRGLIWHEVLSEPMVLRRRKRSARSP